MSNGGGPALLVALGCLAVVLLVGVVALVVLVARRNNQNERGDLRRLGLVPVPPGPVPPGWRPLLPDEGRGIFTRGYRGWWRGRPVLVGRYAYRAVGAQGVMMGRNRMVFWMTGVELRGRHPARTGGGKPDWHLYDHQLLSYRIPMEVAGGAAKVAELDALGRVADGIEPPPG